jgi:uncharacterized protein (TIGR03435 family)
MRLVTIWALLNVAYAQLSPTFEVATVKSIKDRAGRRRVGMDGGPGTNDPVRWNAENMSLANLVNVAYDLPYYRVSGAPWTTEDRFDIVAKVPPGATKDDLRLMLQHLLAERFRLKVHREDKEMQIYELVVAKGGPKMPRSGTGEAAEEFHSPPRTGNDGYPALPKGRSMLAVIGGRARMQWVQLTVAEFADRLANQLSRPVVDMTSLDGKYDFVVSWSASATRAGASIGDAGIPSPGDDSGPTLQMAVQEQLGLRLNAKKGPVEIIVIDSADRSPAEN